MALYHKHRPQKLEEIVGQEHVTKTISNQISSDKVAHAYIFSGPRGIGKTTTARILAKAANCKNKKEGSSEPCNKCDSCEEVTASRAIDVIEMDAASHTGVDNVRENIIDNAQFKPTKSKYKIFIIDEVHMLSTSAFNALLKTLEEPPSHIIFILATTELHKIPDTIKSRCQRFNFHKVKYDDLKKYLGKIAKAEGVKVEKEVIDRLINKSDGCVRDAISLLDQILTTGEDVVTSEIASIILPTSNVDETVKLITELIEKNSKEALHILNKLNSDGTNLSQLATDMLELLRFIMIGKASGQSDSAGPDLSDTVKKQLGKLEDNLTFTEIVELMDLILTRKQEIKTSPLPILPLEMAIIEWTTVKLNTNADNTIETNTVPTEQKPETKEKQHPKEMTVQTEEKVNNKKTICSPGDIEKKWNEFVEQISTSRPSLAFIFKSAELQSVEENKIIILVDNSFHKDTICENGCKKELEKTLSDLTGGTRCIEVIVRENANKNEENNDLQDLASALGGEVV